MGVDGGEGEAQAARRGDRKGEEPGAHGGDSISRNAVLAFATQMATAFFTAVLTFYLVRALGPTGFGTFSVALGISGVLLRFSDIGIRQSAARYVAEHMGDTTRVLAVVGMSLRWRIATATATAAGLFVLAGPIADLYDTPELTWVLRGIAVSMFGQNVMLYARGIFTAMRRNSWGLTLVASESAVEFMASVALVALGTGATGAAFGRGIGYLFGAAVGVVLLSRYLHRSVLWKTGESPVGRREFSSYAFAMLIVGGSFTLFSQLDVLLIGAILGAGPAGIYSAPLRLIILLEYPGLALSQGISPRMSRNPNEPPRTDALEKGLRYLLILQAATGMVVLVWAEPIVNFLLGDGYGQSADVLRALTPFIYMRGLSSVLSSPLNYYGESRRRIPVAIGVLLLNVAIDVVLLPKIGILAAAIGTNVSFAIYLGVHVWLCHKLFALPLRRLTMTVLRSFLAAAAMAVPLVLAGTATLTIVGLALGGIGALLFFVGALLLTREVSTGELRALWARLRGLLGGRRPRPA